MPTPKKGEEKQEFISRCISYMHKNEDDKYPDDDQKTAICYSMWDQANESTEKSFADFMSEASFKRVNRVRGGKLQKRKKVASKPGYKVKDGKVVKMKASEKLARKRAAKKSARKRKGKKSQIARKTKKSMKLRKRRGL